MAIKKRKTVCKMMTRVLSFNRNSNLLEIIDLKNKSHNMDNNNLLEIAIPYKSVGKRTRKTRIRNSDSK